MTSSIYGRILALASLFGILYLFSAPIGARAQTVGEVIRDKKRSRVIVAGRTPLTRPPENQNPPRFETMRRLENS